MLRTIRDIYQVDKIYIYISWKSFQILACSYRLHTVGSATKEHSQNVDCSWLGLTATFENSINGRGSKLFDDIFPFQLCEPCPKIFPLAGFSFQPKTTSVLATLLCQQLAVRISGENVGKNFYFCLFVARFSWCFFIICSSLKWDSIVDRGTGTGTARLFVLELQSLAALVCR